MPHEEGNFLISVDYCQLELRILAHFSQDEALMELCSREDCDIHTLIASKLFIDSKSKLNISSEMITEKMRNDAKTAIYATIYGKQWGFEDKNKNSVQASNEDAPPVVMKMNNVLDTFKGVKTFIANVIREAKGKNCIESFSGKRRLLPKISLSSDKKRDERITVNTVIQGSAADFVKFALLRIVERTNLIPIIQIHDEWIFETNFSPETKEFNTLLENLKQSAECSDEFGFSVPIPVKISYGQTYDDLH